MEPKPLTAAEIIARTKQSIADTMEGIPPAGEEDDDGSKGTQGKEQDDKKSSKDSADKKTGDDKGKDTPGGKDVDDKEKDKGKEKSGDDKDKGTPGDDDKDKDLGGGDSDEGDDGDKLTPDQLEIKRLKEQNEALLGTVDNLSDLGLVAQQQETIDQDKDKGSDDKGADADKASGSESKDGKPESVAFVTDDNLSTILESAEGLNKLLNDVANRAALQGEQRGFERAVRETPQLVSNIADQQIAAREAARDFLEANPEMLPVRKYLGMKVNELQAKNPTWLLKQLFEEAGKATTEDLKLSKVADAINKDDGAEDKDTGLPGRGAGGGGGGKSTGDTSKSKLQRDIGSLVEYAEGNN